LLWISISILFKFFCKDNQIDKHLRDKTLQCIISEELKGNHILQYDDTFSEEKEVFEKTKICDYLSFLDCCPFGFDFF
jgi:hypothetical protein